MTHHDDLYAVLGVGKGASDDEIRTAYRKLARKHHPDRNPGDAEAEKTFKKVAAAYEVLSDSDKRALYDEFGPEALQSGFDAERAREYQRWSEQQGQGSTHFGGGFGASDLPFDLGELFDMGFGEQGRRSPRRGADLRAVVELELAQAVHGAEVTLQVPDRRTCASCGGSGDQPGTEPTTCPDCSGTGQQQVARGPMRLSATCRSCAGEGRRRTPCVSCRGTGQAQTMQAITVRIPPGADDGSVLRIAGRGAPGERGGVPGDLLIETRVKPHPHLRREGLDLFMRLPVSLDEAYNGARIELPTLDGRVKLSVPPRSQPGAKLRLRGRGVRRGGEVGDLYVELDVRLPERHDPALADALRQASSAYAAPVRSELRI